MITGALLRLLTESRIGGRIGLPKSNILYDNIFMLPQHFLLKLILTPLIVAVATLAARRWGESIGGWLIGLPLTSAPVSVFFAIEQGRIFAAHAATGAVMGVVAVSVFCTAYSLGARETRWQQSALIAIACYIPTIWIISQLQLSLGWAEFLALAALCAALLFMYKPGTALNVTPQPAWDLPLRMLTATIILIAITTLASSLGPLWSGLLSPFPIFTFVMAIFSQSQSGAASARRVVRGVVTGLFGYVVFFLVVGLLVTRLNLIVMYSLATLSALSVNAGSLVIMLLRRHTLEAKDQANER